MKRRSKIDKVAHVVFLRDGTRWVIDPMDEQTVRQWPLQDEIEYDLSGLNNLTRNKKIRAMQV
jgi:hypothetical protein